MYNIHDFVQGSPRPWWVYSLDPRKDWVGFGLDWKCTECGGTLACGFHILCASCGALVHAIGGCCSRDGTHCVACLEID